MHRSLEAALACPSCRTGYTLHAHEEANDDVLWGYLRCPGCAVVIPIAQGFAFFTEPLLHAGQASRDALEERATRWFGTPDTYSAYHQRKFDRGEMEPYAAFHPFNESTRALDAVIPVLDAQLRHGDLILDPWSRTGWSAEWLAAHFTGQRVVALWEGDRSVLGYRGYRHWLAAGKKSPNLDVIFAHPERGLPFRNESFALLYALDSFHRFSLHGFAGECLRVSAKTAPLVLAHLHLTNSEPEPWFDRGCNMYHGRDYRAWLDAVLQNDERTACVWSEIDLFHTTPGRLPPDSPETEHYNGFILVAPRQPRTAPVAEPRSNSGQMRLLVNPLFRLHLERQSARIERGLYDGIVGEMMDRHPVYRDRLPKEAVPLSAEAIALMALAVTGHRLDECAKLLGRSPDDLAATLAPLVAAELILPAAVGQGAYEMQRFHANQKPVLKCALLSEQFLRALAAGDGDLMRTGGGDVLEVAEAGAILSLCMQVLSAHGIGPRSRLGVGVMSHPLGFMIALAGIGVGAEVVLLPPAASAAKIGPVDLLIHADGENPAGFGGRAAMKIGLDGAEGSFAAELQAHEPSKSVPKLIPGAIITSWLDDRPLKLEASVLIEAAVSLSAAVPRHPVTLEAPWTFANLFTALVALRNRQPILLRGLG